MVNRKTLQRGITVSLVLDSLCLLVSFMSAWANPHTENAVVQSAFLKHFSSQLHSY